MTAAVVVLVVGVIGGLATELVPALEMWTPLILSIAGVLAFMLWLPRDGDATRRAARKAA
jgi:hypothetical protein